MRVSDDLEDVIEEEGADDMGVVVLMLGLYLIVLAFFILLNAISESSDEKTEQASMSVAQGFGFQLSGPLNMRDDVDLSLNPVFEIISDEIENVLESYVSIKNYKFSSNADQMVLRISAKEIFNPGAIRIRPAMANFFEDLSRVVSSKRPGTELLAQVVVHLNEGDRGSSKMPLEELAARRASLFVRALIERGVQPNLISAAYEPEDLSQIELFFNVVVSNSAQAMHTARQRSTSKEPKEGPRVPEAYPPR